MRKHLLIIFMVIVTSVSAQPYNCDPCGDGNVGIVSRAKGEEYRRNYSDIFRTDVVQRRKFSESAEFSRADLLDLINASSSSVYCGFNIYLLAGEKTDRPGHDDADQIGLALVPRKRTGFPDFSGRIPENFAFNRTGGYGSLPGSLRTIPREKLDEKRESYKLKYPNDNGKRYTRYVLIGEETRNFLADFIKMDASETYKTYRFYLISYNKRGMICEQGHKDQISIMIVPVDAEGPKYEAFDNFFATSKYANKKKSLNHGSLCPNYCPDGDY